MDFGRSTIVAADCRQRVRGGQSTDAPRSQACRHVTRSLCPRGVGDRVRPGHDAPGRGRTRHAILARYRQRRLRGSSARSPARQPVSLPSPPSPSASVSSASPSPSIAAILQLHTAWHGPPARCRVCQALHRPSTVGRVVSAVIARPAVGYEFASVTSNRRDVHARQR